MKLKSPCIDACRIDTRSHWCTGCGRTVEMTPYRQRSVLADLERRVTRLRAAGSSKAKLGACEEKAKDF